MRWHDAHPLNRTDTWRAAYEQLFATPEPRYDAQGRRITLCQADDDGDCTWAECPQRRDGEPRKTGRHCPLDSEPAYEGESVEDALRRITDVSRETSSPENG